MSRLSEFFGPSYDEKLPPQCRGLFDFVTMGFQFPAFVLLLQLFVIMGITLCLQSITARFGMPRIIAQFMAGFILSPGALGRFQVVREKIFPPESISVMRTIALIGYTFNLFSIAVKMDFGIIFKTGKKAWCLGTLVPLLTLLASTLTRTLILGFTDTNGVAFGTTFASVISFPVVAVFVSDMGLLNSEIGRLALSASLITEFSAISIMAILNNGSIAVKKGPAKAIRGISMMLMLIIFVRLVMRPIVTWMIRQTPQGRPVKGIYVMTAFLLMLVGALWSDGCGQFVILGAFVIGAGIPDGPPLGSAIEEKFDTFLLGFLEPFFISASVMTADLAVLRVSNEVTNAVRWVFVVALLTKVLTCCLFTLFVKMDVKDAITLGLIFAHKGSVDLASYSWWFDFKMLSGETFASLVVCAGLTAAVTSVGVRYLYDPMKKYAGFQRRDVAHNRLHSDLKLLVCIHRPENITCTTNLLDLYGPTMDCQITAYVLHLVKLTGRCHPIVISHDMQSKRDALYCPYSDDVLLAFNRLKRAHVEGITLHAFTAVAPPYAMHENICDLALDKLASIILLPFHRKFGMGGHIESEDSEQRSLNLKVLARSPCSVAILVDRGHHKQTGSRYSVRAKELCVLPLENSGLFSVAVIFIGGDDDLEAFAFARRMCLGKRIWLTVIRLVAEGNEVELPMSDTLNLSEIQNLGKECKQFTYSELMVTDGADTATKLRSAASDFDLLIVGRRYGIECQQTAGMSEWTEIRELGAIGDMLASPDSNCKGSVMVVQQQVRLKHSKQD